MIDDRSADWRLYLNVVDPIVVIHCHEHPRNPDAFQRLMSSLLVLDPLAFLMQLAQI